MRTLIIILASVSVCFWSCQEVSEKAKETINKTGETVGRTGSEFFQGVSEGIDKGSECKLELSQELIHKGLEPGKFYVKDSLGKNNVISIYLIFANDIKEQVLLKVVDSKGLEYGRTTQEVSGKKNEARFFDFVLDKRTDIESKSTILLEVLTK